MRSNGHHSKVSPFVAACFKRIALAPPKTILDVPCGFGRHSQWLASLGHDVVALDIDLERVCATNALKAPQGTVLAQVGDVETGLPFPQSSFDAALVIHYVSKSVVVQVGRVLKPGGYLIFETFGGQGDNWTALPKPGEIRRQNENKFELMIYRETLVGPNQDAVSVKMLARKR